MGCGASSESAAKEEPKNKETASSPKAPQVRMTRAAELAAKAQRDKAKGDDADLKKESSSKAIKPQQGPPPTIRTTRGAELLAKSRQEDKAKEEERLAKFNLVSRHPTIKAGKKPPLKKGGKGIASPTSKGSNSTEDVEELNVDVSLQFPAVKPKTVAVLKLTQQDFFGWKPKRKLGTGSFGVTYEALLKNGKLVCCKQIEFGDSLTAAEKDQLLNEIRLMERMSHVNIVQYYGCLEDLKGNHLNIFMELVTGGCLNHFMKKYTSVPLEVARDWTKQMLEGVKYLHDNNIIHRDIKGANILVTRDGVLKVADFGCSKSIDEVVARTCGCNTMVGTPFWMAPEVLKCEPYGPKADIWSVGCTIIEMVTGGAPWPEMDNMWAAVFKIANSTGPPPNTPKDLPKNMTHFLERCFEREPKDRASAEELLNHPWIVS